MNERTLDRIGAKLGAYAGLTVSGTMRSRLIRYLHRVAESAGVSPEEYADTALAEPALLQELIDELTVQESSFFRDGDQFDALTEILPHLTPPILIWSCGCGRGQEPYSLAMVLLEGGYTDASVLATDISTGALVDARSGRYRDVELRGLSPARRDRWMEQVGDRWSVREAVRQRVRFARHNLASGPPPFQPGQCQVIFCRNVLIYFREEALLDALKRMYSWLSDGGLLFLGQSESLWQVTDVFGLVRLGHAFAYRRPGPHQHHAGSARARPPQLARAAPPARAPASTGPRTRAAAPATRPEVPAVAPPTGPLATAYPDGLGRSTDLIREGELAMAAGDPRAAAGAFRQAAYLDPAHPVAHFQLGLALEAQGDVAPAARAFRAARTALRRLDPASSPPELLGYRVDALIRLIEAKLE